MNILKRSPTDLAHWSPVLTVHSFLQPLPFTITNTLEWIKMILTFKMIKILYITKIFSNHLKMIWTNWIKPNRKICFVFYARFQHLPSAVPCVSEKICLCFSRQAFDPWESDTSWVERYPCLFGLETRS